MPHAITGQVLADEKVDLLVRKSIADALGKLGEQSIALCLVNLLADETVDSDVRWRIANALAALRDTAKVARSLATLLRRTDLPELAYGALYHVSQRAGVRVL